MSPEPLLASYLREEGVLDAPRVEQALAHQRARGGTLAQALVALQLIEEGQLAGLLSRRLRVPLIRRAQLGVLRQAVLDKVPPQLARERRVFPVALAGGELTLAMSDPWDEHTIAEVSFSSGSYVLRAVAAESLFDMVLDAWVGAGAGGEQRWNPRPADGELADLFHEQGAERDDELPAAEAPILLTRPKRPSQEQREALLAAESAAAESAELDIQRTQPLIDVWGRGPEERRKPDTLPLPQLDPPDDHATPPADPPSERTRTQPLPLLGLDGEGGTDPLRPRAAARAPVAVAVTPSDWYDDGPTDVEVQVGRPAAAAATPLPDADDAQAPKRRRRITLLGVADEASGPRSLEGLPRELQRATTTEEAMALLLEAFGAVAERRLLLRRRERTLVGVAAVGRGFVEPISAVWIDLTTAPDSLLAKVLAAPSTPYAGPLPFGKAERHFATFLGRHPERVLLMPLTAAAGLWGILYADGFSGVLPVDQIQDAGRAAGERLFALEV